MSLKLKFLALVFSIVAFFGGLILFIAFRNDNLVRDVTTSLVRNFDRVKRVAEIQITFKSEVQEWKNILLRGADKEQKAKYVSALEKTHEELQRQVELLKADVSADDAQLVNAFDAAEENLLAKYREAMAKFLADESFNAAAADAHVKGLDRKVVEPLHELTGRLELLTMEETMKAGDSLKQLLRFSWLAAGLAMIIAIVFSWRFVHTLIGSLDTFARRLGDIASSLLGSASTLSGSGAQLAASSTQQAAAIEETSATLQQMSAMIGKTATHAQESKSAIDSGRENARYGKDAVESVSQRIKEIAASNDDLVGAINESNSRLTAITQVITEIGNKTKVINEIVFQTKLLSFNASVEAARAGEHGKGFAVVAEEVGNLAQMSGNAAREISSLLDESRHKVDEIVQTTRSQLETVTSVSREKVSEGERAVEECSQRLDAVTTSVADASSIADNIASASDEQAAGVHEIVKTVTQLDQSAQHTVEASDLTSRSAADLKEQALETHRVVNELRRLVQGSSAANVTSRPTSVITPSDSNISSSNLSKAA